MIGLVLVTHGRLGEEMRAVLEHVVGPQAQVACVGMQPKDDMEEKRREISRCVAEVDTGLGVLILTDMFGGTPSNLAISLSAEGKVEALAGVNLPMLVKLASARRTETLHNAALLAQEAGRKHIHAASALLKQAS
jgi:mannose PTS system EIIA component